MLALVLIPTAASAATGNSEINWADYRLAVGAEAFIGGVDRGSQGGTLTEVNARIQLLRWLGVGLSYFKLSAYNNNDDWPLAVRALELFGSAHPLRTRWLDPYVRVGALNVVSVSGGGPGESLTVASWGIEGIVGLSVTPGPIAFGVDIRSGSAGRAWTMLGLHLEVRIPL